MAQYIDKDAVAAEIEKRIKETESMQPKFDQFWAGQISAFKGVLKILDTLDTKEVGFNLEDSIICNLDWYDGPLLDYTQDQQDSLLRKIGAVCGDKVRLFISRL